MRKDIDKKKKTSYGNRTQEERRRKKCKEKEDGKNILGIKRSTKWS
jgi:hypothetical protein